MVIPSLGLLNASVSQDINSSQDELREGRKAGRQVIFSLGQEINHQELNWFGFCLWCPFVTRTQCSCYIWIWQEKSWLKKSYHTCMMEDERKDKGDLEGTVTCISAVSKFPSSISSYIHSICLFTRGKGRVPLGECGISRQKDHRQCPFSSGFSFPLSWIGVGSDHSILLIIV